MLALGLIFIKSEVFIAARDLMRGMVDIIPNFPYFKPIGKADPYAIWPLDSYPYLIGKPIVFFGLLGIFLLPVSLWKERKKYILPYIVLTVWTLMLFIVSRFPFLSNPERAARDLAVPMSILAGIAIVQVFALINKYSKIKWMRYILYLGFALYLVLLSIIPFDERKKGALEYNPMIRLTNADNRIISYLKSEPAGIILIGSLNYYAGDFLPGWDVHYLYRMTEEEKGLVFEPANSRSVPFLSQYDYIYLVSNQSGWVPPTVRFDYVSKYIDNPNVKLIMAEQSDSNEVLLFKVVK